MSNKLIKDLNKDDRTRREREEKVMREDIVLVEEKEMDRTEMIENMVDILINNEPINIEFKVNDDTEKFELWKIYKVGSEFKLLSSIEYGSLPPELKEDMECLLRDIIELYYKRTA